MKRRSLCLDREILTWIGGKLDGGSTYPELDVTDQCGPGGSGVNTCGVTCRDTAGDTCFTCGTCNEGCVTDNTCGTCNPTCHFTCQC